MSEIDTKDYIYVMISTLNQMVNYIPLRHFKFNEIYNITIQESDFVNNSRWDEQLSEVLKRDGIEFNHKDNKHIRICQDNVNDIEDTIDILEANFSDKNKNKIFWNITGGQRPFILAITQFIQENKRKDDYICYLEGNKSKMVILQDNEQIEESSYNLDDLKISTALELMGFKIKEAKNKKEREDKNYDKTKKEFYLSFLEKYINLIKDKRKRVSILTNLIKLNANYPSEKKQDFKNKLELYNRARDEAKRSIKELLNFDSEKYNNLLEKEIDAKKTDKSVKSFGYILEGLAGYKILEVADTKIADINFSEKINHLRQDERTSEKEIDEFDIALLTKNGKFMIFECKSGGMDGDVAKSTKYSTYAVSGVYGKPILITPLLKEEIIAIRKKSTLSEQYAEEYDYLQDDLYKTIRQAINSAIRAGLEVWGLDEIEKRLKKYIEEDIE